MAPARFSLRFAAGVSFVAIIGTAGGQAVVSSLASAHMSPWRSCLLSLGVPALITFAYALVGIRRHEGRRPTAVASCKYGNETQCKAVFETLPAIVWTADRFGKPVAISSSSKHICGHPPEDLLNSSRTFLDLLHPDDIINDPNPADFGNPIWASNGLEAEFAESRG